MNGSRKTSLSADMEDNKTVKYWRNPTPYEIKFGEGAIHWLDIEAEKVRKADGSFKKWFIHTDGLRYNR